jgi:RNA polymerase sigma-70 factor (ECF subfamily)
MAEDPPAAVPDDELLCRITARDAESLALLFRRHYGQVYRFALHVSGTPAAAEDVAQDVFVAVMRDAARYEPGRSSVATWLFGIARNIARRRFDQERRVVPLAEHDDRNDDVPGITTDPLGELIEASRLEDLRKAILTLPIAYREVIALCDLQELSYADAAGAIGCAVGTVRSRLHRGRALLVSKLKAVPRQAPDAPKVRFLA